MELDRLPPSAPLQSLMQSLTPPVVQAPVPPAPESTAIRISTAGESMLQSGGQCACGTGSGCGCAAVPAPPLTYSR